MSPDALKVLGKLRRGELLMLLCNPEEHKVWLEIAGSELSRKLYVAALEEREIKAPALKLEFEVKVALEPRVFLEAIKGYKIFDSQNVRITIKPDAASISSQGETEDGLIKILKESRIVYEVTADDRVPT